MRAFLTTAFLTTGFSILALVGPALAQEDPNLRTPSIYVVEHEGVRGEFVVGDAAWGDVLATLSAVRSADESQAEAISQQLWERRDLNPPVFLFEVARREAATNPERALEAYFLGRARSVYDAMRCVDSTSMEVVDMASQYAGEGIVSLLSERLDLAEPALQRLLDSDAAFSSQASPWWACSFGQAAYYAAVNNSPMAGNEWLRVEGTWSSLQDTVRRNIEGNLLIVQSARAQANAQP